MKNPFDPFGVFGEWRESKSESESWESKTLQEILDSNHEQIDNVITDAAWAGIQAERQRCLDIIRTQSKSLDNLGHIIKLIEGNNEN